MKLAMLCGSPRGHNSTSMYLLKKMEERINAQDVTIYTKSSFHEFLENIYQYDTLLLAFPLYVDGIPASTLEMLASISACEGSSHIRKVYAIINNGFYEARQNEIAITMLWKWCEKCNFIKGYALAIGAGEMVRMAPLGKGPNKNLGEAIQTLLINIQKGTHIEDVYIEPNFPRYLYKCAAHFNWRKQAKQNGLKGNDMKRKN